MRGVAARGVDGYDRAFDVQHVQEPGDRDDLVGLFRHLELSQHKPLPRGEGRDDVDRRLVAGLAAGAPGGLAIDGDHLRRHAAGGCGPGHKALLEALGIERGEDLAQAVMGGRPMAIGPEPAQQIKLRLAKPGDVGECLSPRQHRQERQQQHFVERIDHLDQLPRIRQLRKMLQKYNGLICRFVARHHHASFRNPIRGSQIQHLWDLSRVNSPDCPVPSPQHP